MKRQIGILKRCRFLAEYAGVLAACAAIRIAPLPVIRLFASIAGFVLFCVPVFRRLIRANLRVAFPNMEECEIRRITFENTKNTVLAVLELVWFSKRLDKLFSLMLDSDSGAALTRKERIDGNGVVWVAPHLGNWELAGFQIRKSSGMPFAVVVNPQMNPYLDKIILDSRSSGGNMVIGDRGAVKSMIKALKSGYCLATLIDQNTRARDGGVFVNFFGLPVATSRMPALFARKLDVRVATGCCVRVGNKYRIFTEELPRKASEYASDEELIQDIVSINEKYVRLYPEQYLWMYKRWLYIPENAGTLSGRYPYYARAVTKRFYSRKAQEDQE